MNTSRTDLLDVNVWIALTITGHPQHARAVEYWQKESAPRVAFCRVTMLGLLRVSTRNPALKGQSLTSIEAWRFYQSWLQLPDIVYLQEPSSCEDMFERLTSVVDFPARLWTDAYLAAFARSSDCRLVTFDRDFRKFPNLELLELV